jgi:CheY-like chemotaxis protein
MLKFVLMGANFSVISAADGVTAMVNALKEKPAVVVVDVRLPKIHGVEVMKRLATRSETKDAKVILVGTKPEAQVPPIKGAAGYIHEDRMQQGLVDMIRKALEAPAPAPKPAAAKPAAPPAAAAPAADAGVARAERFCRTVLADIDLYNKDQVADAIRAGNFEGVFAKEIAEGMKLYEMRISEDVRAQGDFYNDAIKNFIEKKKKQLGI